MTVQPPGSNTGRGWGILRFVRGDKDILNDKNMVFREGEPVYERDTKKLKIGDGVSPYRELPYFSSGSPIPDGPTDDAALWAHIQSATPHPAYDDGPSLVLLYNNAKV